MKHDLFVIGLGIYGSSVAAEAAQRGLSVVGIDQFAVPHQYGSSHGRSRIVRLTTVESEEYIPLVRRSLEIWKRQSQEVGVGLLGKTGFALIAERGSRGQTHHGVSDLTSEAGRVASRNGIPYELFPGAEAMQRFPSLSLSKTADVFWEPDAMSVDADSAVQAAVTIAEQHGARIMTRAQVLAVRSETEAVVIETSAGIFRARQVVLATGPWLQAKLLDRELISARVYPQVTVSASASVADGPRYPAFALVQPGEPLLYGIPPTEHVPFAKVATEQVAIDVASPDVDLLPYGFVEGEQNRAIELANRLIPEQPFGEDGDLCFYTVTPDSRPVVQSDATDPRITAISACSGHGFKYAPAVAERLIARLATL